MLIVTGCAASGAGVGRHADAVVPIPTVLDSSRLVLPVERYMFTDRDMTILRQAQATLTRACMKRFGFDWPMATPESSPDTTTSTGTEASTTAVGTSEDTLDAANTARRYGLTDPRTATEHGYHNTGPGSGTPKSASGVKLNAAETPVLTGVGLDGSLTATKDRQGIAIPAGGCLGEAILKLSGTPGVLGDGELVSTIDVGSYDRSYADVRVTAVFRKWSACMKAAGFAYSNPTAAPGNGPQLSEATPSALEIAIAKSDVECKRRTNLVGIWYAVDSAYQQVAIAHDSNELAGVKQHNAAELAKARTILSDARLGRLRTGDTLP